nr:hypothetical protein [Gemmatimonadota bacterium]
FVPRLWRAGIRNYRAIFNVPGDPVGELIRSYRDMLDALHAGTDTAGRHARAAVGAEFTRGHFARAV